jgi:hypothetical protein
LRSDCEATSELFRSSFNAIAQRRQSEGKAIRDFASFAHRLRSVCVSFAQHSRSEAIAQRSRSDSVALKRFQSDSEAFAKIDSKAIQKRLRSDSAAIAQ